MRSYFRQKERGVQNVFIDVLDMENFTPLSATCFADTMIKPFVYILEKTSIKN